MSIFDIPKFLIWGIEKPSKLSKPVRGDWSASLGLSSDEELEPSDDEDGEDEEEDEEEEDDDDDEVDDEDDDIIDDIESSSSIIVCFFSSLFIMLLLLVDGAPASSLAEPKYLPSRPGSCPSSSSSSCP